MGVAVTLLLVLLAAVVALNPLRAAAVVPADLVVRRDAVIIGVCSVIALVVGVAVVSGPVLDSLSITGSSSRIAAGVALVITSLRDVFAPVPNAEPALPGRRSGFVPLAFPTLFTPAVAALALAAGHERGVLLASVGVLPAVLLAGAVALVLGPGRSPRSLLSSVGLAGVVLGALVTLDGIYAI